MRTPAHGAPVLRVAFALVWRDGQLLISQRPAATHLGGLWEFPGGKVKTGEAPEACAVREVLEETGVHCQAFARRTQWTHRYPERVVELIPIDCSWLGGEPQTLEVADVRWVHPRDLNNYPFPEANRALLTELQAEPIP